MAKKSNFEKAATQFGRVTGKNKHLLRLKLENGIKVVFCDMGDVVEADAPPMPDSLIMNPEERTVGELCKFIASFVEVARTHGRIHPESGEPPPAKVAGTGTGGFEELLMQEAARLEKKGKLTMGRYPVASVMIKGDKFPRQVPSLPDFEGVFPDGRQFIIEAKVCSQPAFEIVKDKIKPKQVRHMLKRHGFGVPGWVLIHFNAREGKTFYEPPLTVALPVLPESEGGHPLWEKFAATKKGEYVGSISRDEARRRGMEVYWHTPARCRTPRPDLWGMVMRREIRDQEGNVYFITP